MSTFGFKKHEFLVGQYERVAVHPAVGGDFGVEFVTGARNVCGVETIEKIAAPAVGVHAETREFPPGGNGIKVERHSPGFRCRGQKADYCQQYVNRKFLQSAAFAWNSVRAAKLAQKFHAWSHAREL